MKRIQICREVSCLGAWCLAGAALALHGCSANPATPNTGPSSQAVTGAADDGSTTPISQLPLVDDDASLPLVAELLAKPTALGETTALHVRLPPPQNPALADSLVSVIGDPDSPQVLFRSDALAALGVIPKSPGSEFFTAFATVSPDELAAVQRNQDEIASGVFGKTTNESVVFEGRAAVGRTINPVFDPQLFLGSTPIAVKGCAVRPVSTLQAWGQALFITDPAVVQDHDRTWDPCTGNGTKGGVWTFAHLIREMANGSGFTPEDFVRNWLALWLNDYVVNSDNVPARTTMFAQVIQPWAAASNAIATLSFDPRTKRNLLTLKGTLNLDIAPFRLLAIVNRIDLGETEGGGGGGAYNGSVTGRPKTAGELRFIFGVVQPNPWGAGTEATCGKKYFTTILEYGVPIVGCQPVVDWAKKWAALISPPGVTPGFTSGYLAQLQTMTESVVVHGAAPAKGNQNALNQIRTNEGALAQPWELREFTLTDENPVANTNFPSSGLLRKHSVAKTPNDSAYGASGGDPAIDQFVQTQVLPPPPPPPIPLLPPSCTTKPFYDVPYFFLGKPFRGGNSFILPGHWEVTPPLAGPDICARHMFSLTTCDGCHYDESGTNGLGASTKFFHADPMSSIPVTLSKFLTGGGPSLMFNVNDPQLGAPVWQFADLERRFQRLFDLSHCTLCAETFTTKPDIIAQIQALGPVPADVNLGDPPPPFQVGPITDLGVVQKLLDLRSSFAGDARDDVINFIHVMETLSH